MSLIPSLNRLYKLQFEKAQDSYVLLFPEGMITLNPSASEILLHVDGQRTNADIVALLQAKFPDAEGLENDVTEFLLVAQQKDWIHYD